MGSLRGPPLGSAPPTSRLMDPSAISGASMCRESERPSSKVRSPCFPPLGSKNSESIEATRGGQSLHILAKLLQGMATNRLREHIVVKKAYIYTFPIHEKLL